MRVAVGKLLIVPPTDICIELDETVPPFALNVIVILPLLDVSIWLVDVKVKAEPLAYDL